MSDSSVVEDETDGKSEKVVLLRLREAEEAVEEKVCPAEVDVEGSTARGNESEIAIGRRGRGQNSEHPPTRTLQEQLT
jgi:hypothetical protein